MLDKDYGSRSFTIQFQSVACIKFDFPFQPVALRIFTHSGLVACSFADRQTPRTFQQTWL